MRAEYVYISGKIGGLEPLQAQGHFNRAANELAAHHNFNPKKIINPLCLNDDFPAFEYEHFMKLDLCLVEIADIVYMLNNWRDSNGAKEEYEHAKKHGKKIMFEDPTDAEKTKDK